MLRSVLETPWGTLLVTAFLRVTTLLNFNTVVQFVLPAFLQLIQVESYNSILCLVFSTLYCVFLISSFSLLNGMPLCEYSTIIYVF